MNMAAAANQPARLSQKTIKMLHEALTKTGNSLLTIVDANPHIQHKELAGIMSVSTSSLSNILTKIMAITPPLLHIEISGRSKYYTLTNVARDYVKEELTPQTSASKIRAFIPTIYEDRLTADTIQILSQCRELSGPGWNYALFDFICGREDLLSDAQREAFSNLLNSLKALRIRKESSLKQIYDELDYALRIKLQEKIGSELREFYLMEPLILLEKSNLNAAIHMIDHIFSELYPYIYGPCGPEDLLSTNSITGDQYRSVFYCIAKMSADCLKERREKADMITDWKAAYFASESTSALLYIVEKCNTLVMLNPKK